LPQAFPQLWREVLPSIAITLGRLAGDSFDPGDEALLEGHRIQGAELVVRGRAIGERPEPTQQRQLLLFDPGDTHSFTCR